MKTTLSKAEITALQKQADATARRLVRQLRMPQHEREDLRQDLLADLLARFAHFDPRKGSLGAFAATVMSHRAARLARRVRRERRFVSPISLDGPVAGSPDMSLADIVPEEHGISAMHGQDVDRIAAADRRIDLDRASVALDAADASLCAMLMESSPTEITREGAVSRAHLYRRLHRIRLDLVMGGLATAARETVS